MVPPSLVCNSHRIRVEDFTGIWTGACPPACDFSMFSRMVFRIVRIFVLPLRMALYKQQKRIRLIQQIDNCYVVGVSADIRTTNDG